jgi:hypothetical protein
MLLSLCTLTWIDDMKVQATIPLAFGFALFVSQALLRQRDLVVPLWFGRQSIKWAGITVLSLIFVGYAQLQRGFSSDEQRKMFLNY